MTKFTPPASQPPPFIRSAARVRVHKNRKSGGWTVTKYWHGAFIGRTQWRDWDYALAHAVWWVHG